MKGTDQGGTQRPFSEGFAIKNAGFEHATAFITTMFNMLGLYIAKGTPFRAVIEYDPEQDCNTHVYASNIEDEHTKKPDNIQE